MKYKGKSLNIKRAREAKQWKNYYFGNYLLVKDGVLKMEGFNIK